MSQHIKKDDGTNLCGSVAPNEGLNVCILCDLYNGIDRDHDCKVVDIRNGFAAVCSSCGYEGRVKPTPSAAQGDVRAHWRETLGQHKEPRIKKPIRTRVCHCGCTELTAGGTFRAGHDARWLAQLRRAVMQEEMSEADAKVAIGEVSEKLLLKFQHALQGRVVS